MCIHFSETYSKWFFCDDIFFDYIIMSITLSNEINYSTKAELHPNYRLDQLTPQSSAQVVITNAGGNNSLFEINPVAFNLNKSYLCFDYVTAAPIAARVANVFRSVLSPIRQIQFYARNGQMMCDLQNFDVFSRVIFNSDFSIDELANGNPDTPVYRNNTLNSTATIGGANGARPGLVAAPTRANLSYIEQAYVNANLTATTATTTRYRIPFSFFKNTILALNKDLYFGDITYLRIYWNQYTNLGFISDGLDPPVAFAAFAANVNIDNLYMYLAVETNEKINATLAQTIASPVGLNTLIDFVYQENFVPTGATPSFYVKYGPGMGQRLKRIYWCFLNTPAARVDDVYNIENMAGAALTSFYAELDGHRIIQYNIQCGDAVGNQDYMILSERLKGGAIQIKIYINTTGSGANHLMVKNYTNMMII